MLDGFQPLRKGGYGRAFGPALIGHVWAGNVPGLPLWSLISGLLVKSANIGKLPSAEPLMAGWFAAAVADIEPRLADCIGIVWWKGGDEVRQQALLDEACLVLAYGETRRSSGSARGCRPRHASCPSATSSASG